MYRKSLGIVSALAVAMTLVVAAPAGAHTVTVGDNTRTDWFGKGPGGANVGAIVRDAAGRGEYVWTDTKGDQRQASPIGATGEITREADLTRFSVTADATNLYFQTKVEHYSGIKNDPALQVMVAIDRNHSGGETALPDGVNTNVGSAAAWEYVVQSRFKTADKNQSAGDYFVSAAPWVYSSPTVTQTVGSGQLASASVAGGSYAEIAVPWSAIGGKPAAPQDYLRFTVATFYSDHRAPNDLLSKAIDTLSPTGATAELSDGTINSYVDLHFKDVVNANSQLTPEIFAPLLISEFLPDPIGSSDPDGEWIEIYNPNSFNISLNGYKIGDQAYRGGSQGMLYLPATQTITANTTLVIANNVPKFKLAFPSVPASQIIEMKTLTHYTDWGTGNVTLQNKNDGLPFKESIALLDPNDTIVDLVQYAYKTATGPTGLDPDVKPILLSGPNVEPNASYDRCPSNIDTNDGGLDFFVRASGQTPGVACTTVPGVDLRISKEGPDSVSLKVLQDNPSMQIHYTIPFINAGASTATNIVITDTLPAELTFVSESHSAGVSPVVQNGRTLTWNLAALASQGAGSITVNATVKAGQTSGTEITNSAGISSTPSEADTTLHNNIASQTLLVTAVEADLTVFTSWAQASGTLPGGNAQFSIFYQNLGGDDATDITIVDTLPQGVSFVSADVQPVSVVGNVVTWHVDSLASGQLGVITLNVKLASTLKGKAQLQNFVEIASNPADYSGAGALANTENATATVGNSPLFIPMARIFRP